MSEGRPFACERGLLHGDLNLVQQNRNHFMSVYDEIAKIEDRSLRGYAAQLLFRAEVAARGFVPSTPEWNLSMDHVLIDKERPHRLLRVEVKQSAQKARSGGFVVELRGAQGIGGKEGAKKGKERLHYYEKSVDLIAIFLPLAQCWYLIPEALLRNKHGDPSSSVTLNPDNSESKFYTYKENWDVIDESMHEVGDAPTEEKQPVAQLPTPATE
jgi:hypothetical protein